MITFNLNFENISSVFLKISLLEVMFSSLFAAVCGILVLNKFCDKKYNLTSISHYNKPIIVRFAFLPLKAAFYKFSTLLIVAFDPIARFRSNIFRTVCSYKTHPPIGFLSLQIVAVMHHKPENSKFWAIGVRKKVWWGTFL